MKALEVESVLATNLVETSYINKIRLQANICKSPDGDDIIYGIIFTMDDHVKTELKITAVDGVLKIELSQMQPPKPQDMVRTNYLNSSKPIRESND